MNTCIHSAVYGVLKHDWIVLSFLFICIQLQTILQNLFVHREGCWLCSISCTSLLLVFRHWALLIKPCNIDKKQEIFSMKWSYICEHIKIYYIIIYKYISYLLFTQIFAFTKYWLGGCQLTVTGWDNTVITLIGIMLESSRKYAQVLVPYI